MVRPMESTGQQVVDKALEHLGEDYVLGAVAALDDSSWRGPWDCSLFASWCLYQVSNIIYGCIGDNPATADPYTGAWADDSYRRGKRVEIELAARTPGAFLLRVGQRIGHIVISDGTGGTIEAKGAAYGVVRDKIGGRRWDYGILVPGISYESGEIQPVAQPSTTIYRLTIPRMAGAEVEEIQRALLRAGYNPGDLDQIYGPQTCNAVIRFQRAKGLVADGEVGPITLAALGVR